MSHTPYKCLYRNDLATVKKRSVMFLLSIAWRIRGISVFVYATLCVFSFSFRISLFILPMSGCLYLENSCMYFKTMVAYLKCLMIDVLKANVSRHTEEEKHAFMLITS